MSYRDVYYKRVSINGTGVAEVSLNAGIRSFEKWLKDSTNTVSTLKTARNLTNFSGIILPSKDNESKKVMELHVKLTTDVVIGDIILWDDDKWLIFQKEHKTRNCYQSFEMVKCNYLIKWVGSDNEVHEQWCYFVSSLDSKIKENYRTWNDLISPLPNKYAEILLPTSSIERGTRFIVDNEAWYAVEIDHSSVSGVMYISLSEEKVNLINDDLETNIADTDKLDVYTIDFKSGQEFAINTTVAPIYAVYKNGIPVTMDVTITSSNLSVINADLTAIAYGESNLTITLEDRPTITATKKVTVITGTPEIELTLTGPDILKLNRTATYTLSGNTSLPYPATFTIDDTSLATITTNGLTCTLKANDENKLGTVTITAHYFALTCTKTVQIMPLW